MPYAPRARGPASKSKHIGVIDDLQPGGINAFTDHGKDPLVFVGMYAHARACSAVRQIPVHCLPLSGSTHCGPPQSMEERLRPWCPNPPPHVLFPADMPLPFPLTHIRLDLIQPQFHFILHFSIRLQRECSQTALPRSPSVIRQNSLVWSIISQKSVWQSLRPTSSAGHCKMPGMPDGNHHMPSESFPD